MKIAIICFAIFVCAVCASEESDNAPIAHQVRHDGLREAGYVPYVTNQANQEPVYRPPQPQRRSLLSNPILLILLLRLLNPSTTTDETTTMAAPNPYEGWTKVGDCYYLFPDNTATWDAAQSECVGAIGGGRLAVEGFSQAFADRQIIVNKLKANGATFWIGAKGEAFQEGDVENTLFTAPLATTDPEDGVTAFIAELYFGAAVTDNEVLCGRVGAADGNKLIFEPCAEVARLYMCEVCPA